MTLKHLFSNIITLQLTAPDPAGAISELSRRGLLLSNIRTSDALTVCFDCSLRDSRLAEQYAQQKGYRLILLHASGMHRLLAMAVRRKFLITGLLAVLFLSMWLPSRIFFLEVEGNRQIPEKQIVEACRQSGLSFGASRRSVRSEKIKNSLMELIPEIQWAGVNTKGCVAHISIRERNRAEAPSEEEGVCSIVACRDGIISEMTALRGNALCRPGMAVKKGEILISGYTDCGLTIRAQRADGEVYARTQHVLQAIMPQHWTKKGRVIRKIKKYGLIIGKKRLNLCKDSGIPDALCDRMYREISVTLPGGFQIPVRFVTEIRTFYEQTEYLLSAEEAQASAGRYAGDYLASEMIAGTVLKKSEALSTEEGKYCLESVFTCREMIGRVRKEEIIAPYGKHE